MDARVPATPFRYAIALGSNRRHGRHGGAAQVLGAALRALEGAGVAVTARARVRPTPPLGPGGRRFANGAALIETGLGPPDLLRLLKAIERGFGRRPGRRWGARVLDLDILLWSDGRWRPTRPGALAVPHRALPARAFVLDPLAEIAPGWRVTGAATVRQLRARLHAPRPVDRSDRAP